MTDIRILCSRKRVMVQAIISIRIFIGAEVPDRILQKQNFPLDKHKLLLSRI
ncbi:hypothetical protein OMAG_001956 [Candidatus Omnitrophus magneticus]|uniref:Uncharacterized protein n=1 Tax=Candidatus Omnitrophus magneticus TaxID=1609969 RepID=A0A0F0CLJ3_9BACT|nr:hypothetical protein OMAG_001956 [Candidatus Omnitrophus magneticus]